jgi:hypothetical protein
MIDKIEEVVVHHLMGTVHQVVEMVVVKNVHHQMGSILQTAVLVELIGVHLILGRRMLV